MTQNSVGVTWETTIKPAANGRSTHRRKINKESVVMMLQFNGSLNF